MSPEQAQGERVDQRTDLFSLGSVMFAMCTGQPPFRGSTNMAVLKRVCENTPRPAAELNQAVPAWLEKIVNKLLAKEPDKRFQTAAEVAELLADHLSRLQQPTCGRLPRQQPRGAAGPPQSAPAGWLGKKASTALLFVAMVLTIVAGGIALTQTTGMTFLPQLLTAAGPEGGNEAPRESTNTKYSDGDSPLLVERKKPTPPSTEDIEKSKPTAYEIHTSDAWEWTEPEMFGPGVNTEYNEEEPHLTADGLTLLFISNRPGGQQESCGKNYDLWVSRRASSTVTTTCKVATASIF